MEKDYGEILCTAIDEIVSARLQGLSYDITKQCTVKDDSRAHQGRYVVSDGGSRFEAFSADTSFKNGNNVLVTIPNGDFSMQKTIVGRIASIDTTPFKYVSPLDSMIKIKNGMLEDIQIKETSLLANKDGRGSMIECFTVPSDIASNSEFAGYTRLGIQADFKSVLNGLDVVEGSYGIKILIYADVMTSPGEIDKNGVWELTFSSEEMVGNPYQFVAYFQQEKVFDISDIANIREIKVYFYQNGNFIDINGNPIADSFTIGERTEYLLNNLFVNNFKFYFGYELERYDGETLELYPEKSTLTYHHSRQNELKTIGLRWIHQTEDGLIELLDESKFIKKEELDNQPEFEVRWFRYNFGYPVIDSYAKVNWEQITECENYLLLEKLDRDIFINNPDKVYAYLNESNLYVDLKEWPDEEFPVETKFFEKIIFTPLLNFTFSPNINLQSEKIKVIGLIRKKNGIEFNKEEIEANGGDYAKLSDIQTWWDKYFTEDVEAPSDRYIQTDDGYEKADNGEYVKLTYTEILGLQNTIADDEKTSAQYLEDVTNFIQSFTLWRNAYILDPYYSRELTLTNEERVVDDLTYDAATALAIICEDGSEGNYLIYDQNGRLKNEGQGQGYERNFLLTYKGLNIDIAFERLDDIDWVEWYIPSDVYDVHTSTMLSIPNFRDHSDRLTLDGVDYLTFRYNKEYVPVNERYPEFTREMFMSGKYYLQDTADTSKYIETKEWNAEHIVNGKSIYHEYRFAQFTQPYSIKNTWIESASNNVVRAAMSINGNTYEALDELKFGKGGSNGTNATFLLEFLDNANAMEATEDKWLKVKARLYEGNIESELDTKVLMEDANWLKWKFPIASDEEDFIKIYGWKSDKDGIPIYESGKATLYCEEHGKIKPVNPAKEYYEPATNNLYYRYQDYLQESTEKAFYKIKSNGEYTDKFFKNEEEFIAYLGFDPTIRYLKFEPKKKDLDVKTYFKNNFHILQATYKYNNIDLVTYLSVPLKMPNTDTQVISHIEGTKEVNYNHQGQPSYYANPYKLFKRAKPYEEIILNWKMNDQEIINIDPNPINLTAEIFNNPDNENNIYYYKLPKETLEGELTEAEYNLGINTGFSYSIRYTETNLMTEVLSWPPRHIRQEPYVFEKWHKSYVRIHEWPKNGFQNNVTFYQTKNDNKNTTYVPALQNVNDKFVFTPSIYFAEGAQNKICVYCYDANEEYYWSQPILIYKHRYDFDILNAWNGGLKIDEENGTIMANMLGAGRKNPDNTFSGVMIGDMAKGTGNDSAYSETGVYGLYKGDVSFALKDSGKATFGVANRGQIHIDGNESTITSAGYTKNLGGMLIDLDDGVIDIQEAEDKDAGLYLRSRDDTYLIKIDNQNQVLRSNQYSSNNGMEINLGQGYINIAGLDGQVKISENTPYFSVKGNASIGNKLYIKQDDKIIEKLFYNDFIPDAQYYIDEYCTLPISFVNEQEYKVYLQNLKPLIEIGAPKMTETASGFYLRSLDYNPADAKVENTSGNYVYESTDGTYHSLDSTTDTWYQNTNTNQGYVQTTNKSDIGTVSSEELKKAKEDWQKANVKDDGSFPPVPENVEKVLLEDLQNGKRAEFESKLSLLYSDFGTGLQLDLQSGKIEGYNLFLRAVQEGSKTNSLLINSSDSTYPFIIGGGFKVSWKGDLTCRSWHYGTIRNEYKNSVLCINSGFYVKANGKGYISDAGYASSAGYANSAGWATEANHANSANSANTANTATRATYANIAEDLHQDVWNKIRSMIPSK